MAGEGKGLEWQETKLYPYSVPAFLRVTQKVGKGTDLSADALIAISRIRRIMQDVRDEEGGSLVVCDGGMEKTDVEFEPQKDKVYVVFVVEEVDEIVEALREGAKRGEFVVEVAGEEDESRDS